MKPLGPIPKGFNILDGKLAIDGKSASALVAGHGLAAGKRRNWMSMVGYAAATAIALYTILDLEFPRIGLIRLDGEDRMLVEVLDSMK